MLLPLQGWVSLGLDPMTICRGEVGASRVRQKGGSPTLACFLVCSHTLVCGLGPYQLLTSHQPL